jgi:2-polyprenyl-3-methyl-5-hydroxy-6-metoxy-1,4-benzoquinol methylase
MRANGWAVMGLEPSQDASKFARKELKLDVLTGFIDKKSFHSMRGYFDVITMWHVLEHVHEPQAALALVANKLEEEGLLVIAVPNIASLDARMYWIALDVPRHLLHFTPETMEKLVNESGMMIIKKHQIPLDTVFNSLMSEMAVIRRSTKWLLPLFLIRLSVTIICSWFNGIHDNKGSSVMYYIRKKKN